MNQTKKLYLLSSQLLIMLIMFSGCNAQTQSLENNEIIPGIEHGIIHYEEGRYAGWPANHGIWIWDNEILVGFIEAEYRETGGFHTYNGKSAKSKYARSLDGGTTWSIEDAFDRGQTARGADHSITGDSTRIAVRMTEAIEDFTSPDFILTFQRHNNNNGPTHFYFSNSRGKERKGPFEFSNLETRGIASRTDYIVDGKQDLNAFLTTSKSNEREGRVAYARTTDGGLNWEIVSWVGPEHGGFDIMPSSVRISPNELVTVIRTRTQNRLDLLTAYRSTNNGETWERLRDPVADTGRGGSPPAIVKMQDDRLALAYIYRSEHGSRVNNRFISDDGTTWSDEIVIRGGDGAYRDTGYPRMVQRPDGKLVIIYYWNYALQTGGEPFRYIATTVVDPTRWN